MLTATVMIVEDDRIVARDIRQQVDRMGYSVVATTGSGEKAVALARSIRPDLVLMDIRLEGDIDGIEAARQIRSGEGIPVIFLTAYGTEDIVRRASETDPFGYLLKPFEEPQMRTVIQMALFKRRAEATLRLSERRYSATLASISDGVITIDENGCIDFINPIAERLTGWSSEEAVGRHLSEVFLAVDAESRAAIADPTARSNTTAPFPQDGAMLLVSRNGSEAAIEARCSRIMIDQSSVAGTVLVFTDITDRLAAAEALQQAHAELADVGRLAEMGELAATVVHEVNQPLMAIVTNAGTCLQWLDRDPPEVGKARAAVERVIRDGHRAGGVVRSIHALVKRAPAQTSMVTLNEVVSETVAIARRDIRRAQVAVTLDLQQDLPEILGDRVQLQQMVLNLIVNAIEAMQGSAEKVLTLTTAQASGAVQLSVRDTGPGVESGIAEQIFDALFTTKEDGLGMGLSISRSIVAVHGGTIETHLRSEGGCEFRVSLPVGTSRPE
jgi:PAS domain S-box-containing protein